MGRNLTLLGAVSTRFGKSAGANCAIRTGRPYSAPVMVDEVGNDIISGVAEYATLADRTSRLTLRARILKLIDRLQLAPKPLAVRSVGDEEIREDVGLRGALILHLDLSSRSAITSSELIFTASTGRVLIVEHPDMPGFPLGLTLLLPSTELPVGRRDLFSKDSKGWGASPFVIQYAIATNPGGLGAGRALQEAAKAEAGTSTLVAYAPLTGLRARIIQIVDDPSHWKAVASSLSDADASALLRQLTDLLAHDSLPDLLDEPAASFLRAEARNFAEQAAYRVGEFHRHMGAKLIGIDDGGDPSESDSMWARAYLEY